MKKFKTLFIMIIVSIVMMVIAFGNAFSQNSDPIEGKWYFDLNHKIDYNALIDTARVHGLNMDTEKDRATIFTALAAVVISRCENSTILFSPFENQVMLTTTRYNDPTTEDRQWGKWFKFSDGRYMVEFKNRIEFYRLNELTGEYYYEKSPSDVGIISTILEII